MHSILDFASTAWQCLVSGSIVVVSVGTACEHGFRGMVDLLSNGIFYAGME